MRLALRRSILHQLLCIQLGPMHVRTGKGPAGTLNTNRLLDNFKPRTGIYHPLYKAEVAVGQGLTRPHLDYEVLHGHFGRPVEFNQLLQLVTQRHWVFGSSILGLEQLLH